MLDFVKKALRLRSSHKVSKEKMVVAGDRYPLIAKVLQRAQVPYLLDIFVRLNLRQRQEQIVASRATIEQCPDFRAFPQQRP